MSLTNDVIQIATIIVKGLTAKGIVDPTDSSYANNLPQGQTGPVYLQFGAIVSENPVWTSQPTVNPIENGATVTDHVRTLPRTLNIKAIICDLTPAQLATSFGDLIQLANVVSNLFGSSNNPVQDAYNYLFNLWKAATPFDFVSGLDIYQNLVIAKLSIDRTSETGNILYLTITFQEVLIVQSQTVLIPASILSKAASSAASNQAIGQTPAVAQPLPYTGFLKAAYGPGV